MIGYEYDIVAAITELHDNWNGPVGKGALVQALAVIHAMEKKCQWSHSANDYSDYWETTCGNEFSIIDGTPEENNMKYCPHCGYTIEEA